MGPGASQCEFRICTIYVGQNKKVTLERSMALLRAVTCWSYIYHSFSLFHLLQVLLFYDELLCFEVRQVYLVLKNYKLGNMAFSTSKLGDV